MSADCLVVAHEGDSELQARCWVVGKSDRVRLNTSLSQGVRYAVAFLSDRTASEVPCEVLDAADLG